MAGADIGGIASVVLNYYQYINKSKIHFDVAITSPQYGVLGEKMILEGMNIFHIPLKSADMNGYIQGLTHLLTHNTYDAIHVHENETSYVALYIAKKMGIKVRIAHAHTSSPYISMKSELKRIIGCILNSYCATNIIGCGKLAGNRVFGKINMRRKKAVIIPNAIDVDRYKYNSIDRKTMREELRVDDKYIIGMVGRLSAEKNHLFALNIMKRVKENLNNCMLLIVGDGTEFDSIQKFINDNNMTEYVEILGRRQDVEKIYQAFDLYILPSLHEGFPVSLVEAMASGLPCLISSNITDEFKFGSYVEYVPLEERLWEQKVLSFSNMNVDRTGGKDEIIENGLDIKTAVHRLEEIYFSGN
jgi:glycosyltransferase involved in cell wall biosynthesis